jgi:hypothetical protein
MDSHLGRCFSTGSDAGTDPGKKRDPCQWTARTEEKEFATNEGQL